MAGLVSFSLSASLAEARFFLGLEASYGLSDIKFDGGESGKIFWGSNVFNNEKFGEVHYWVAGINLGTQHDISDMLGWRWFFGVNYGENINRKNAINLQYLELQLGGDILFNFTQSDSLSFGAFTGIAGNFNSHSTNGKLFTTTSIDENLGGSSAGLIGRVGLALVVGEHNRFELTTNIPIMQASLSKHGGSVLNPITFTLGYKFIF